ncbi:MAG TPA: energy-coupling factor ABC transporter ATP-binding protein [Syntrophomonadaceae bacterium]|nr:energy-coupling factor ABC transporter ATP-binding protein [Syntrophomonadaceae bacterium]
MALFEIENLTYFYPESDAPALENVNLHIEEGELLLIVGGSGSGKSSLARLLAGLIPDFYGGKLAGRILFRGKKLSELGPRLLNTQVGIVFQDPEKQLVMTTVEAEIAFGLENLGLPQEEMFRRVSEVLSFLGLTSLKHEFTANLSGGQKQKVALAAVLAMQPRVLILDEPTSQLDPPAADEFFNLVERLNKEMGYTVVLIEQRLERCFHLADRLAVMENGKILRCGPVKEVARWEVENSLPFIPPVAKFFATLHVPSLPLTVKEGRKELKRFYSEPPAFRKDKPRHPHLLPVQETRQGQGVLEVKNVWFTYPNGKEALKGVTLRVNKGEFAVVIGENAAGKSTLLKQMVGILKPGRGKVLVMGKDTRTVSLPELARHIGYLAQNPNDYLFQDTVEEELRFTLDNLGLEDGGAIDEVLRKLGIIQYRKVNPRDLSSGERQRVALAAILVAKPTLLVLDEPTRGIDYRLKKELGSFLAGLAEEGLTVLMVTHDMEFAAEYAGRIIMMFDGRIVSDGSKHEVLGDSLFYAPQMTRLFKDFAEGVLTVREGIEKISANGDFGPCLATKASL